MAGEGLGLSGTKKVVLVSCGPVLAGQFSYQLIIVGKVGGGGEGEVGQALSAIQSRPMNRLSFFSGKADRGRDLLCTCFSRERVGCGKGCTKQCMLGCQRPLWRLVLE